MILGMNMQSDNKYSVQFTDMHPFGVYEKYNLASKFNWLIINAKFP